jgi:pterin-4a-carbinolamine dehydratase
MVSPSELRRSLRRHPEWKIERGKLVRELRLRDFEEALACMNRLAAEVDDFGRRPDICLLDGDRVRVAVASPHHAGFSLVELRLVEKVDAALQRGIDVPAPAPAVASHAARPVRRDAHELPLRA